MKVVTGKITNNESVSCGIDSSEGYAQTRVKTKNGYCQVNTSSYPDSKARPLVIINKLPKLNNNIRNFLQVPAAPNVICRPTFTNRNITSTVNNINNQTPKPKIIINNKRTTEIAAPNTKKYV